MSYTGTYYQEGGNNKIPKKSKILIAERINKYQLIQELIFYSVDETKIAESGQHCWKIHSA